MTFFACLFLAFTVFLFALGVACGNRRPPRY